MQTSRDEKLLLFTRNEARFISNPLAISFLDAVLMYWNWWPAVWPSWPYLACSSSTKVDSFFVSRIKLLNESSALGFINRGSVEAKGPLMFSKFSSERPFTSLPNTSCCGLSCLDHTSSDHAASRKWSVV